jgi:hypothetical protein
MQWVSKQGYNRNKPLAGGGETPNSGLLQYIIYHFQQKSMRHVKKWERITCVLERNQTDSGVVVHAVIPGLEAEAGGW